MAKEEKILDVKERKEKVSQEDLVELKKLVNSINAHYFNIGRVENQKHEILHRLAMTQDEVTLFQDKLMKTYGSYDVNINTGVINWPKDSEQNGVEKPKEDEK